MRHDIKTLSELTASLDTLSPEDAAELVENPELGLTPLEKLLIKRIASVRQDTREKLEKLHKLRPPH